MKLAVKKDNRNGLSLCDAAELVLRKEGKPMTHHQIAQKIVAQKLVHLETKTPQVSVHILIRTEMKRRDLKNEPQRFVFLGNGIFSLVDLQKGNPTAKTKTAIEQIKESKGDTCKKLYEKLTSKNQGSNFEIMVSDLLIELGYQEVEVIGGRDDQGVDIICIKRDGLSKTKIAIQCKCKKLSNEIGPKDVSTLRDNLSTYQCQQGILITTSLLNADAKNKAQESGKDPVFFIEHDEILSLFAEHNIGITSENVKYYQIDNSDYDFLK